MKVISIIVLMAIQLVESWLCIEELRKMVVNETERRQLQILNRETLRPRQAVRDQVAIIARNQNEEIQRVYQLLLTAEGLQEQAMYELDLTVLQNIGASSRVLTLVQKIREVDLNMTLSRKQAAEQIRDLKDEVKRTLTKSEKAALDNLEISA